MGDYLGHMPHHLSHWLDPVVPSRHLPLMAIKLPLHEAVVMIGSSILAIVCFAIGIFGFRNKQTITDFLSAFGPIQKVLEHKYYIDELYAAAILRPLATFASWCSNVMDKLAIDGAVNGIGNGAKRLGQRLRTIQDGDVQSYALIMVVGLAVAVVAMIVLGKSY